MTSRLARAALVIVVAAFATLARPLATQPAARVESIDVAVTTDAGSSVAGLTSSDFEVLVDGKPTAIQSLVAPPAPVTLLVLFDVTASMMTYGDIGAEIERSLAPSLRAQDRARIGGIANRLVLSPKFTAIQRELIDGGRKVLDFRREDTYGPSPIWDALVEAVRTLEPEPGRRGILLVTDGRGTGNTVSATDALLAAVGAGTVIQVLSEERTMYFRQDEESYARVRTGLVLEEIARQTGGMILPEDPKPTAQLPPAGVAIARLVSDLREMYTIGVLPEGPPGSAHRVQVKVKRAGLTVRARSAYRTR